MRKVIKPTHALLELELRGPTYVAASSPAGERVQKAFALSRVTARPQSRLSIELAAGEPWLNGPEIKFKRDDPTKPWRLHLDDAELRQLGPDMERILVIEQDHVPFEGGGEHGPWAARTIFAAAVEGPFLPRADIEDRTIDMGDLPNWCRQWTTRCGCRACPSPCVV